MIALIDGYETWTIDPETGERVDLIDSETSNVHEETFVCSMIGCNWEAGYDWWEKLNNGEQEEEKDEIVVTPIKGPDPIQPSLFKTHYTFWPPTSEGTKFQEDLWNEFWTEIKKPDKT